MKKLLFVVTALLLISCSVDEPNNSPEESQNQFLSFQNWQDFYQTYEKVAEYNDIQLNSWLENQGHVSYFSHLNSFQEKGYNGNDEDLSLTRSLKAILNKDRIFRVGSNFIVLEQQKFYTLTEEEFGNIESIRSSLSEEKLIGEITVERNIFKATDLKATEKSTVMNASDIAGSYQKEFIRQGYVPCAGGANQGTSRYKFKYVHELLAIKVAVGYPNIITELYLDLKLEYHNGSWNNAGEDRNLTVNVSGTAENTSNNPRYTTFNINRSISCVNNNQRLLLAYAQYPSNFGPEPDWIVSGSGTITQQMNQDAYSNKWTNYVSW